MENLKGKKVVVLGASSGIGFAVAKAVADEAGEVVIVSSNQVRLDAALKKLPPGSQGFAANLTDDNQISELFTAIGRFDHLVYTAGESLQIAGLGDLDIKQAKHFFDLRYWGAFAAAKYALPFINSGGSIIL